MITYLPLYHTPVLPVRDIFLSKEHVLRIMDIGLRKAPCVFLGVIIHLPYFSINHYLLCSLQIYKICALCGIFCAISVLSTTENSDDLEIRDPDRSRSLKVIPVNSSRVISY